ncbi:23S rRNA (adenine(1618)-N(6))-methyltransferase RlmF [Hanstruepera ponticola]|uniref:23S rRNA (adenine(1618)-N(6))-methyltransferase RlmF n=1 Tax=Hanstruepera ponticola TaxID=2042995 RepID=UPI00293B91D9|nr:23S rRNA (adenine(1618)-N(6))-methyltransferase RlmF [Hanstruepera ponticola]
MVFQLYLLYTSEISMHKNNKHHEPYNFLALSKANPVLKPYVFSNDYNNQTIDFADSQAVYELNKAILILDYNLTDYLLPAGYLCPPIPGRADYIHHLHDLLNAENATIMGLDVGVGANCIYPILASQIYDWKMIGCDINFEAVNIARHNVNINQELLKKIDIRHQENPAFLFTNIIKPNEYYHFTMCNPPFHSSESKALKGTKRKWKNLKGITASELNFGGQAHELWCNGGEALFIKRMIKESVQFRTQVGWFTTLVAKGSHLPKLQKQLDKLKTEHQIINMAQGQKQSRILAWRFKN